MGNEQSASSTSNQLVSQRDNDIFFSSCSTSHPIGADVPVSKLSPRVPSRSRSLSRNAAFNDKIIVVAAGKKEEDDNGLIKSLDNIPVIQPFLPLNSGLSFRMATDSKSCRLDSRALVCLCERFREHMRVSTEECLSQQDSINHHIKEVSSSIHHHYSVITERRNKQARQVEQVQKVTEILATLSRIHSTISHIIPLANDLNHLLPEEQQLETLTVHPLPNPLPNPLPQPPS